MESEINEMRRIQKWQGIEQEFRVGMPLHHKQHPHQQQTFQESIEGGMRIFKALKSHKFFGSIPAMIYSRGYDGILRNGSRIYLCNFSLEIATPECRNAFELLKYDKAMEFYMQIASEIVNCVSERGRECEHENGLCADAADVARVCVWRANTELNPSFTRGTHENYAISRDFKKELILPFLVLKPIFFGAGGYVSEKLGSEKEMINAAEYVISPRAIATKYVYGGGGERKHPIFSIKGITNLRIHVDSGEGLRLEVARFLNNAITSFVICAIEDGKIRRVDKLEEPLATFKAISRETGGEWKIKLENGSTVGAIDYINSHYLDAIEGLFEEKEAIEWDIYALKTFKRLVEKMNEGLLEDEFVVKRVEWLLKMHLLERDVFRFECVDGVVSGGESEKGMRIAACFAFSNVCDADFYEAVADEIGVERLLSEEDIADALLNPPRNSRASLRNRLLEEIVGMGEHPDNIFVRWNRIICPPTREKEVIFDELDGWDGRRIEEEVRKVRMKWK